MSQIQLTLPQTLHDQLDTLAKHEGVSLPEYILYILAYQARAAYTAQPVPQDALHTQHTQFSDLLKDLGQATVSEIQRVLGQRDVVQPEEELRAETTHRLQQKIAEKQSKTS